MGLNKVFIFANFLIQQGDLLFLWHALEADLMRNNFFFQVLTMASLILNSSFHSLHCY